LTYDPFQFVRQKLALLNSDHQIGDVTCALTNLAHENRRRGNTAPVMLAQNSEQTTNKKCRPQKPIAKGPGTEKDRPDPERR
jgi:hypothetical protein